MRKTFGAVPALDGASFAVRRGEVHALLGENGAGKSSLMNVAGGLYVPNMRLGCWWTARTIDLSWACSRAKRHGIGMVHQHFKLVKPFTVAENISVGKSRTFRFAIGRHVVVAS